MKFSVIYSYDVPDSSDHTHFFVPKGEPWIQTEGDEQFDNGGMEDEGEYEGGKHGKWVAILDRKQFDAFVSEAGLSMDDVDTGGMIGGAHGMNWVPAMSFDDEQHFSNAYVCPMPDVDPRDDARMQARAWRRIYCAMLVIYGSYTREHARNRSERFKRMEPIGA